MRIFLFIILVLMHAPLTVSASSIQGVQYDRLSKAPLIVVGKVVDVLVGLEGNGFRGGTEYKYSISIIGVIKGNADVKTFELVATVGGSKGFGPHLEKGGYYTLYLTSKNGDFYLVHPSAHAKF